MRPMKVTVLVRKKSRSVDALAQAVQIANRLQGGFAFAIEEVGWLPRGNGAIDPRQVLEKVKEKLAQRPAIAVISPPLKGDCFEFARRGRNVVSTADWETHYAPPPLHIYLLFQFAFAAAAFAADLSPRQIARRFVHRGFRACIFDPTRGRREFLSLLIAGYVCADCEARLCEWGVSGDHINSIGQLLSYVRDFALRKPRSIPKAVFIGHGRRRDWEDVKGHLESVRNLKVEEFNIGFGKFSWPMNTSRIFAPLRAVPFAVRRVY